MNNKVYLEDTEAQSKKRSHFSWFLMKNQQVTSGQESTSEVEETAHAKAHMQEKSSRNVLGMENSLRQMECREEMADDRAGKAG